MTNTNTTETRTAAYARTAAKYLRKYGPAGTYTSTNAPYGKFVTVVNVNPYFGVYGTSPESVQGYAVALESYKPRTRTTRAGETFRY